MEYGAAKAALASFSKALSKEVAPQGVRVNTVSPGPVATDLWLGDRGVASVIAGAGGGDAATWRKQAAAQSPTGRFTTPQEVANLVVLLASDSRRQRHRRGLRHRRRPHPDALKHPPRPAEKEPLMSGSTTAHSLPSKRRVLVATLAALLMALVALTAPAAGGAAAAHPTPKKAKPTVVLVHGAWADGSGWNKVVARLQRAGYPVRCHPTRCAACPATPPPWPSFLSTIPGPDRAGRPLLRRRGHHQRGHRRPRRQGTRLRQRLRARRGRDRLPARRRRLRTRSRPDHGVRLRPLPRRAGRDVDLYLQAARLPDLVRQPGTRPRGSAPLRHATPHRLQRGQPALRRSRVEDDPVLVPLGHARPDHHPDRPGGRWPSAPGRRSSRSRPGTCP